MTLGVQRPQFLVEPPGTDSSAGAEAVELAAAAGLVLDPWQQWVLDRSLRERVDGSWSAFEVALWVSRQNGKGSILEARELAGLVLFGERLIVHSAHEFKTAAEHFLRMRALFEQSDELSRLVQNVYTANGKESIVLRNGSRLLFAARSAGSGRGFTGDLIVFDEAYRLAPAAIGAMMPTLSARPNPQIWYTSSAARADSEVMHRLLRRARSGDPGRLWLADWGAQSRAVDWADREVWAETNPALGIRISEEFVGDELASMRELGSEFARERLGIHDEEDSGASVFGPGRWVACQDPDSRIDGRAVLAVDVSPDMDWASVVGAGVRADGLAHVGLVDRRPGTGWLAGVLRDVCAVEQTRVFLDPKSPAASLVPEFERERVPFELLPAGELARACSGFQRAVVEGSVRVLPHPALDAAQAGAAVRVQGDSWLWGRVSSHVDVSPLVAGTIAHWAATRVGDRVELFI